MTKLGVVTQMVEKFVSKRSATPPSQEAGPSVPQTFGTSYMRSHSVRKNNRILPGDQTMCGKFLHGWSRMLTRDLFAVANLLVHLAIVKSGAVRYW